MPPGASITKLIARNTAHASPNKIHDSDVAQQYGFAGGLVPGVTVFAWMCGPAIETFGPSWLEAGTIEARFARPVYDAAEVFVGWTPAADGLELSVDSAGQRCATGRATGIAGARLEAAAFERLPPPHDPPAATPASLAPGTALGTIEAPFDAARAREYLASISADHAMPAEVAHPGWLILLANLALSSNVTLGPWIHVSSDMRLHGLVRDGETVAALSRVVGAFEKKGHRFVELDVAIVAGHDRPVASVRHVAIYEPRKPAG